MDAHEGWMLGVLDVAGLGLVGYCKQEPSRKGRLSDSVTFRLFNTWTLALFNSVIFLLAN